MERNASPENCLRPKPEVKTSPENISLRKFEMSDLDDCMVWKTDDLVSRFCNWETLKSRERVLNYLPEKLLPHPWIRAICLKNQPVGEIIFSPSYGNDNCRGAIGYVLASKYWGQGIATLAVKLAVSAIFGKWPHLERLEAFVDTGTKGSQRVMEKAGFLREGLLRKYFNLKGLPGML